jgi:hypothetical protein
VLFVANRSQRAGRHLEWKVRLFTIAAMLALIGIYLDERWMTIAALGVLAAGILLRFAPDGSDASEEEGGGEGDDEACEEAEDAEGPRDEHDGDVEGADGNPR